MDILQTRVLIAGAGAVGGYIAARLHEKGVDTTLLTRPERHEQIVCRSLHIISPFGRFRKSVQAMISTQIKSTYDLVILACRAHLMPDVIEQVSDAVGPSTILLSLLDGGPNRAIVSNRFPANRVYDGLVEGRVRIDADGIPIPLSPATGRKTQPSQRHASTGSLRDARHLSC